VSLADLIRGKGAPDRYATATPATYATQEGERGRPVASVATVAVANPRMAITANPAKVGGDDTATAQAWVLHFIDGDPREVWFAPPATHAQVMADHPDAVAAMPIPERTRLTATASEAEELRALMGAIYAADTDQDRREAMQAALADPVGALACYRAIAVERAMVFARDPEHLCQTNNSLSVRHKTCTDCRHLRRPGLGNRYCGGGRDDLSPAYGPGHPLRRLPEDGGEECEKWEGRT